MGFFNYLHHILAAPNGNPSSKRFITMICTILMIIGFLANLFGGYKIDEFIFNAVMMVVIGGMGITGAEKFAPSGTDKPQDNAYQGVGHDHFDH